MRILISGASGFIGSAVGPSLASQGHQVTRLVRREPGANEVRWDPDSGTVDAEGVEGFDAVVHLASIPWSGRWTPEFKQRARANRLYTNALIARTLAARKHKPNILVCASGQGIYAPAGDEILTEQSPSGGAFLARLQCDGEAATAPASAAGIRVVHLRIPMVIGVPHIRGGISRAGSGRQWMSWVGREELAGILQHVLLTDALVGPVNATSPNPLRNAEFMATVNRMLGTRGFPLPALLVRLTMGEMGQEFMLASRRLAPRRLLDSGYRFRFPALKEALRHELAARAKPDNSQSQD
jgi:uncharacterized protein (TIGR01777 family)